MLIFISEPAIFLQSSAPKSTGTRTKWDYNPISIREDDSISIRKHESRSNFAVLSSKAHEGIQEGEKKVGLLRQNE